MQTQHQNFRAHKEDYQNFKRNAVLIPQQQMHMTPGNYVDMVTPNFADPQSNQSLNFNQTNFRTTICEQPKPLPRHNHEQKQMYKSCDQVREPGYPPFPPLNYLQNAYKQNKIASPQQNYMVHLVFFIIILHTYAFLFKI